MPTGVVKWYQESKGFGFIVPDDDAADVFVHASALKKSGVDDLVEGDRVSFETEPGRKGVQAKALKVLAATP